MTLTPWGSAEELRERKLRPGPATSREAVSLNQRERLFGAMVASVAEKGYEATRVSDLLNVAGISRNTFYRHFANKQDCFLATIDAIVETSTASVVSSFADTSGTWDERLRRGMDVLVDLILAHPASARLYYVETYAAGPEAIEKVEAIGDQLERLVRTALEESPGHAGMPRDLVRSVLRGLRRVIQARVRAGRERELVDDGPRLVEWALSYRAPPTRLRRPRMVPAIDFPQAPDELGRDRILTAVVALMAENGYRDLTITAIAQRAAVSLTTFYTEFEGKDEAVVEALRRGASRVREAVAPALRDAPDWPSAIAAGVHGAFAFLARERALAQFSGVSVHSGGPAVVQVRDELLAAGRGLIAQARSEYPNVTPLIAEGIAASIDAMLFDQIVRKGGHRIYELAPTAAYLALVPFVGAARACDIANASR